jgi:hypothetical protein
VLVNDYMRRRSVWCKEWGGEREVLGPFPGCCSTFYLASIVAVGRTSYEAFVRQMLARNAHKMQDKEDKRKQHSINAVKKRENSIRLTL